jgi:myo-inositol 2-dehydrogenase/D-chiro-inositol 1-dehydrogenase
MKVGILGAGRMGAYRAAVLVQLPEVSEVLLANRSAARAEAVAASVPGVRAVPLERIYDEPMDAVVITLASSEHLPALRRLLPRGLPVLCEKPLGATLAETEEVIALSQRYESPVQVGFQRRSDPAYRAARDRVSAGRLGTLYSIAMVAFDHVLTPDDYIPTSGGIFRDLHVHDLDIARWLTGQDVASVTAYATVRLHERFTRYGDADTTAISLVMSDGLPVTIRGARHDPVGHDVRMEILGSQDSVAVGWSPATPVHSLDRDGTAPAAPATGFLERFDAAFRAEMDAFLRFATGQAANPCPPEASREALRAAIACEHSATTGETIQVSKVTDPDFR